MSEPSLREPAFVRYAKAGALAFEFIGTITAGVFLGYQLDAWLDTAPVSIAFMTVASTAIGFYRMVHILRRFERRS